MVLKKRNEFAIGSISEIWYHHNCNLIDELRVEYRLFIKCKIINDITVYWNVFNKTSKWEKQKESLNTKTLDSGSIHVCLVFSYQFKSTSFYSRFCHHTCIWSKVISEMKMTKNWQKGLNGYKTHLTKATFVFNCALFSYYSFWRKWRHAS